MHAPSAFNTQTARLVLVTGARHKKLWQIVQETYCTILGGNVEAIAAAKKKFETEYEAAYGTVMFFEDISIVESMQAKMPAIAHTFPIWSENATGMAQYAVWVALALEGMGASLQVCLAIPISSSEGNLSNTRNSITDHSLRAPRRPF